ncbi:hypothetical protein V6N11_045452 [Hibiscus sabdariffa]|uniref:Uncharacterized protein n=1 Tax=Hibiscus sabdariffa TaxID=183260 RepID=A0ABR2Q102_9ROSI
MCWFMWLHKNLRIIDDLWSISHREKAWFQRAARVESCLVQYMLVVFINGRLYQRRGLKLILTTNGFSSDGGVIPDNIGDWKLGYAKFICIYSFLEAELCGLGLTLDWDMGSCDNGRGQLQANVIISLLHNDVVLSD